MRSIGGSLLVVMMIFALAPETASARLFRRLSRSTSGYSTSGYSTSTTTATNSGSNEEQASTNSGSNQQVSTKSVSNDVSTAQGVAAIMARSGRVGHFGGNPGYEGCGCGSSQQSAYNSCCYSNSGMATVDVGYAQGSNGMWYCCRRYR